MSEKNTSASEDLIDDGTNVTISKQRNDIAIIAACEIEELCGLLRTTSKDCGGVDLAVRGLSARIEDLSHIIMGAINDAAETTNDLAYQLRRERVETVEA